MIANRAAYYSQLAYHDFDKFNEIEHPWLTDDLHLIDNLETDTQCFVTRFDDVVYITFRGTEFDNWDDWRTNFDTEKIEFPFGRIHRGFWLDANSVYDKVMDAVHNFHFDSYADRKIVVTGHSQGAAVAYAFALKMLHDQFQVDEVHGFGCPRVVSKDTAKYIDTLYPKTFYRWVNNNDVVTRIPLRVMDYAHFGQLCYFKETGELVYEISFWRAFLDRIHGRLADFGEWGTDGIKDHDIAVYRELIDTGEV